MADTALGLDGPDPLLEQLAQEPEAASRRRLLKNRRPS